MPRVLSVALALSLLVLSAGFLLFGWPGSASADPPPSGQFVGHQRIYVVTGHDGDGNPILGTPGPDVQMPTTGGTCTNPPTGEQVRQVTVTESATVCLAAGIDDRQILVTNRGDAVLCLQHVDAEDCTGVTVDCDAATGVVPLEPDMALPRPHKPGTSWAAVYAADPGGDGVRAVVVESCK